MFDLDLMVKAAMVAVKPHVRRSPATTKGKPIPPKPNRPKTASLKTVGLAVEEIAPRVDIMRHLSGAAGKGADELAHYYKNMHLTPGHIAGQASLAHAAQQAAAKPMQTAATVAAKRTPTVGVGGAVGALQGIQKAVTTGAPTKATPETLSALMQMPGHALGFSGKYAHLMRLLTS